MNNFRSLQARHEDLIKRSQSGQDIVEDVRKFIEDAKAGSSQISASNERDQLRANLRYWASYLYEHTHNYPNIDLAPSTMSQRQSWVLPVVIVVFLLSGIGLGTFLIGRNSNATPPSTATVEIGQVPITGGHQTPAATIVFTTNTPPPTPTPIILSTPTQAGSSTTLSIQLSTVKDGDEVAPVMDLSGTYSNLSSDYSIHVIIQPVSKGDQKFPMPESFPVEDNSSGTWQIETMFGKGEDLKQKESYLIWVAFAIDPSVRNDLEKAAEDGFKDFPKGVVPFLGPILVNRPAYTNAITGPRLVYSLYLPIIGYSDIFSSDLNGKDIRPITNTNDLSELYPSVSPKGDKIVYVASRRDKNNKSIYSLEIINSDGTSPQTIVGPQPDVTYDRPRWSSDGNYIAYVFGKKNPNGNNSLWNLAVYDLKANTPTGIPPTALVEGNTENVHYISWIPNSTKVVYNFRYNGSAGFRSIDILTKEQQDYYNGAGEEVAPAVSPSGEMLAYEDQSNGQIYVVEPKTGIFTRLTDTAPYTSYFCWGIDEKTIFYSTLDPGDNVIRIWRITLEGKLNELMVDGQAPFVGELNALIR